MGDGTLGLSSVVRVWTEALARSEAASDLAARHGVSRKFVYKQTHKAHAALDDAFSSAKRDEEEVLFELAVTETWLRQVIVGLTLICRSSYRGVVEFLRDLLGLPVSLGHVHDVLQSAARQAGVVQIRLTPKTRSSLPSKPYRFPVLPGTWPVLNHASRRN